MSYSDLSGRVLDVEKQLLGLPTRADYVSLSQSNSSRFNIVDQSISSLIDQVKVLNQKIVNLQLFGVTGSTSGNHQHVFHEVPAGTVNGTNAVFTLQTVPTPATSLMLFKNGLVQKAGSGNDYQIILGTITFESDNIPQSGANLLAYYTV
jgi:hypothetical protein